MVKGRFIVNPFTELALTESEHVQLQDLANSIIMANLDKWTTYKTEKRKIDPSRWKLVKERQNIRMYTERSSSPTSGDLITGNGLPIILAVGTLEGKLDDLMHGVISPTLESMRIKASYVEDFDGAAVLDTIVEPSLEDPIQTLVLKWMEVDIPFASTSLVKNRDYVYLEGTGHVEGPKGERLGYHVMHSVNFPQTRDLPNRVRGNISALAFWQQTGPNTLDMWGTAVMDPGGDMIRMLIVPAMVGAFMSSVKYTFCGQMKKLAWMLERRYEESKQHGAPNKKSECVTCSAPISGRRIGDFGKSNSTSKLCFGFVCRTCKEVRKLSFVDPDLLLSQRKVRFCAGCITQMTSVSSTDAARAMMLSKNCHAAHSNLQSSMSSTSSTPSSISSLLV
ncbi:unnamed protein product [Phytophthora fragariaefolia]|uniref:Unnamed protein product n=1 Tax=Phytophthora fragariaefolia TaxID=1490495 RepID=A0A9W6Y0P3_9STRA|nr:unnamed protein product [Phytophthora fragariaefolia]